MYFYRVVIGRLQTKYVLTFQPIILINRMGNVDYKIGDGHLFLTLFQNVLFKLSILNALFRTIFFRETFRL